MPNGLRFKSIETWRSSLGLLYLPLKDTSDNGERYVLLNGLSGNFCLDFETHPDLTTRSSAAWSSDVGHYVSVANDVVTISGWDRQGKTETYSWNSVVERIHDFHRHLERNDPERSKSVVNHVLRVFRRIRAAVPTEHSDGLPSLKVFLYLMACAATGSPRSELNLQQWGLPGDADQIAGSLSDASWDSLYADLVGFGRYDILRPDFELILRHAGGLLFQEAHMEARVDLNLFLPGLETPARIMSEAGPSGTGVFFTPPAIARTLAEEALRCLPSAQSAQSQSIHLFDPACGSGELLRECLRLLKLRHYNGQIRVTGWDSSSASIAMAQFALHCEKRYWPPNQIQLSLVEQDSLSAASWPADVDVLIMNPPFRSWQQMDSQAQATVTSILGSHLRNKPNLAMAFAIRAITSVKSDGVLAMISPSSLFESSSGKQVREALSSRFTPVLIAKLGDQNIFVHALVDAGLYVGTRGNETQTSTAILWVNPEPTSLSRALRGLRRWRGAEVNPISEDGFSAHLQKQVGRSSAPWVARSYDAWSSYQRITRSKKTIPAGKVFDIHQGVRLGSDVFIVSRNYIKELVANERRFFRPAVMNVSLKDAHLSDDYYVFYPYTTGLPTIGNEEELIASVPTYYADVLLSAKSALASRRSLIREQLNWWDLIWPRNWQYEPSPKLVSKYFGKTLPFAFDGTGNYVVVVGHAWLRRKGEVTTAITDTELYLVMSAYLNSGIVAALLEYLSVQISGGQFDLSNKFLSNLPILDVTKLSDAHFAQLVQIGRRIADGGIEHWPDVDAIITEILVLPRV